MSISSRLAGTRAAAAAPGTDVAKVKPKGSTQNIGWSAPGTPMYSKWDATTAVSVGYYGYVYSYRCARTIATTIAGLPFRAGKNPDVPSAFDLNSPLARLLGPPPGQPAPQVSSRQLLIHSIVSYLVTGKYAWETPCLPGTKTPVALWPLIAANLKPKASAGGNKWFDGFEYDLNAKTIQYRDHQVFYSWRPSQDDWRQPESVLQAAALPLSMGVALDKYMAAFMRNSMVSPTMIVTPSWDDESMRRAFQDQFLAEMTGYDNAGRTSFAEYEDDGEGNSSTPSVQVMNLGTKPVDAQVTDLQKWVRDTICDAYGVPVSIIGQAAERTYENADQEHKNYWTGTILGLLEELLDEINMGLAPRFGNDVGWFDLSGVQALQPPQKFMPQTVDILVSAGIVAISEAREDMGLPPELPTGDPTMQAEPIPAIDDAPSTAGGSSTGAQRAVSDALDDLAAGRTGVTSGLRAFDPDEPRDPLTGEWIGADIGGIRSAADEVLQKAHAAEPRLTATMSNVAAEHGGRMAGLANRLKTHKSLSRKIQGDVAAGHVSPTEAANSIYDANRYTMTFPDADYAEGSQAALDDLRAKGYSTPTVKNFWTNTENPYQGINVQLKSPEGHPVELQFHTPTSLAAKEANHKLYEEQREPRTAQKRKDELQALMDSAYGRIPVPSSVAGVRHGEAGLDGESAKMWEALTDMMKGRVGIHGTRFDPGEPRDPEGRWMKIGGFIHSLLDEGQVSDLHGGSAAPHLVTDENGTHFTQEREALHQAIIGQILSGHRPQENPEYHMLGGGPAAGKSSLMNHLSTPDDAAVIDVDAIRALLPEHKLGERNNSAFTHEESSYIAKKAQAQAFDQRLNVILDGTGDSSLDKLQNKIEKAHKAGYTVHGHYVTLDTEEAVHRAEVRGREKGRFVPPTQVRAIHRSVSSVFPEAVKTQYGARSFDTAELLDNNGTSPADQGSKAKIILTKEAGKAAVVHDAAAYRRFTDKRFEAVAEKQAADTQTQLAKARLANATQIVAAPWHNP